MRPGQAASPLAGTRRSTASHGSWARERPSPPTGCASLRKRIPPRPLTLPGSCSPPAATDASAPGSSRITTDTRQATGPSNRQSNDSSNTSGIISRARYRRTKNCWRRTLPRRGSPKPCCRGGQDSVALHHHRPPPACFRWIPRIGGIAALCYSSDSRSADFGSGVLSASGERPAFRSLPPSMSTSLATSGLFAFPSPRATGRTCAGTSWRPTGFWPTGIWRRTKRAWRRCTKPRSVWPRRGSCRSGPCASSTRCVSRRSGR